MADNLVYHISVTVDHTGKQVPAVVFREPTEGYVYKVGYVSALDDSGDWFNPCNDAGELPHRERTQGDDEDLGLTWQFPK